MLRTTHDLETRMKPTPGSGWLAQLYHENTKISNANLRELETRVASAAAEIDWLRPCPVIQPALRQIPLPRQWGGLCGLDRMIRRRRTVREFSACPISRRALARLLFNAGGVTSWPRDDGALPWPLRSSPSAGALYPLELRAAVLRVKGLGPGVYRYQPYEHCLEAIAPTVAVETLAQASLHPELVHKSAVVLGLFADWRRLTLKYGDRGYRFALLEAGHLAQNVLLTCTALHLTAVPVGGFLDDEVASALGGPHELNLLYLVIVGRRAADV